MRKSNNYRIDYYQLDEVAKAMKDIPEQKYRELIKGIEATAHNQGLFFKLHSGILSMMSFSEKAGGVDSKTVGGIAAPET